MDARIKLLLAFIVIESLLFPVVGANTATITLNPTFGPSATVISISGGGFASSGAYVTISMDAIGFGIYIPPETCPINNGSINNCNFTASGQNSQSLPQGFYNVCATDISNTQACAVFTVTGGGNVTFQPSTTLITTQTQIVTFQSMTLIYNGHTYSIPSVPIPGFPVESLIIGAVLGAAVLLLLRTRRRRST